MMYYIISYRSMVWYGSWDPASHQTSMCCRTPTLGHHTIELPCLKSLDRRGVTCTITCVSLSLSLYIYIYIYIHTCLHGCLNLSL